MYNVLQVCHKLSCAEITHFNLWNDLCCLSFFFSLSDDSLLAIVLVIYHNHNKQIGTDTRLDGYIWVYRMYVSLHTYLCFDYRSQIFIYVITSSYTMSSEFVWYTKKKNCCRVCVRSRQIGIVRIYASCNKLQMYASIYTLYIHYTYICIYYSISRCFIHKNKFVKQSLLHFFCC